MASVCPLTLGGGRVCQTFLGIITDLRVTHLTLSSEVESHLPDSLWDQFCLPDSTQKTLRRSQYPSDKERKAEVVMVIAAGHPHLTKERVLDVLYRFGLPSWKMLVEAVANCSGRNNHTLDCRG